MQAHSASKQTTSPVSALSMRCPPAHCIENTSLFDDMRSPDSPRRDLSRPPLVQAGIRRCVGRGGRSLPRLQGPVGQGRHSRNHVNARLSWLSFCWRDSLDSPPPLQGTRPSHPPRPRAPPRSPPAPLLDRLRPPSCIAPSSRLPSVPPTPPPPTRASQWLPILHRVSASRRKASQSHARSNKSKHRRRD